MLSILAFISSDVIVVLPLSITILNIIDFLPSGTWLPLYSSTNFTSFNLPLIEPEISSHVTDSSTKIDKSFSTNGNKGIWTNLLSLEAKGTNSSTFNSKIATLALFI